MTQARIAPLEPPYSEPVQAALDRIMPAGVPPLALFRTLAVNERVFLRVMAGGLLDRGSLSLRGAEASAGAFLERERLLMRLVDALHDESRVDLVRHHRAQDSSRALRGALPVGGRAGRSR
jgi:hypothetical protein